jgi:hypothetical protein
MTMEQMETALRAMNKNFNRRLKALEDAAGVRESSCPAEPKRVASPAALARLARGATAGAGTDICATCKGEKEARRFNSNRCSQCDGGKA